MTYTCRIVPHINRIRKINQENFHLEEHIKKKDLLCFKLKYFIAYCLKENIIYLSLMMLKKSIIKNTKIYKAKFIEI